MKSAISNSIIIILAIGISAYALFFLLPEMRFGLLGSKSPDMLNNSMWRSGLFMHVLFGVIALMSGSSQFIDRFRSRYLNIHRTLGKIYVVSVIISGIAGLYVGLNATGGWLSQWGFSSLAILWLITTIKAYVYIRGSAIKIHKHWMIRSYSLCFAAVTLRIWLPFMMEVLDFEFLLAYRIVSFLCWVPNLLFAEWLIYRS